ncbi:MAG: hypothetical protein Q7W16_07335 [Coriobacteriia bacterium]|nr:hypothetical protein [Coriobacteriia bacterium]
MLALALKIVMASVLTIGCDRASRRWGAAAGGLLIGLPLISGPSSVFLLLEHGPGFARTAAQSTLLGLLASAAFCMCYAVLARRGRPWWYSLAGSSALCLGSAAVLSQVRLSVFVSLALVGAVLPVLVHVVGDGDTPATCPVSRRWDLPVRAAIASGIVLVVGLAAGLLGPGVAGVLAPLPVFAAVAVVASHRSAGWDAASGLLRGAVVGSWGGVVFFAVLAESLGPARPLVSYVVAAGAAVAGGVLAARLLEAARRPRLRVRHWSAARLARSWQMAVSAFRVTCTVVASGCRSRTPGVRATRQQALRQAHGTPSIVCIRAPG